MSRLLSELLGVDTRDFTQFISRLEQVTHHDGVDNRLAAEIITRSRQSVRELGLDPKDSTYEEVYWMLRTKVRDADTSLRDILKLSKSSTSDYNFSTQSAEKIADLMTFLVRQDKVICMQQSAVKRILHAVPPKKTLKILKFRSISSVLRREDPRSLYALATMIEGDSWKKQITAQLKRLKSRDVHETAPEVITFPKAWVEKLQEYNFAKVGLPVSELGAVILLPSVTLTEPGTVLLASAVTLQAVQTMTIESLPYRSRALTTGLENLIPEIATGQLKLLDKIHGLQPSWEAVYRLLSMQTKSRLPEFEFVLQDLSWQTTETKLASICPELDYWVNSHYLGYATNGLPLSFHLIDMAASEVLQRDWGEQVVSHMRASLWNELQVRYLQHDAFEQAVINQLTIAQDLVMT